MADLEVGRNSLIVFCDCGLVHKIVKDKESGDVKLETKFKKTEKKEDKKPEKKGFFESLFAEEEEEKT